MTESSFISTYTKAIDDLSGKVFIPGLIASVIVELGEWIKTALNLNNAELYIFCVITGFIGAGLILGSIGLIQAYLCKDKNLAGIIGLSIMPLGFAGLFPEYFSSFNVTYSKVTSVAILAWAFYLIGFDSVNKQEK